MDGTNERIKEHAEGHPPVGVKSITAGGWISNGVHSLGFTYYCTCVKN